MIYEFTDYQKYLEKFIQRLPGGGRGFKSKMADVLNCKTSYISLVFKGEADLSLEQAFTLNTLLNHGESESKYFLLLVQLARAGTKDLKQHLKNEVLKTQGENLRLKNRLGVNSIEKKEDEFKYFSSSEYALVHILTTIPQYQTKEAMLSKLRVSPKRLEVVLKYLLDLGLITYSAGKYKPGTQRIHLPDDASSISTHHTNWRIQAIKGCQSPTEDDLHYSSVVSLSRSDVAKIKSIMVSAVENSREIIKESDSEIVCSLCVDFYEIV